MKILSLTLFLLTSTFAYSAEDICFNKFKQHKEHGEVLDSEFVITTGKSSYLLSLSYFRCSCIDNVIVDSINDFLKNAQNYNLEDKLICLKSPRVYEGKITGAQGYYIK